MTLEELLAELSVMGVQLRRKGGDITIRRQTEGLDASLIRELRAHKSGLLELMESEDEWWSPPPAITPAMLTLIELSQAEIDRIVATVPGGVMNVQDIYPLAPLQEGILFHHLMASRGDPYVSCSVFHFEDRGKLDAYLRALQAVVDRHDILRTAVLWEGLPRSVQVVWRVAEAPVEEVDLRDVEGDVGEELYRRYHPRQVRLDLSRAPMMKALTARDRGEGWYLLLLQHHLIGDHATLEVMYAEIEAHLLGRARELPAPVPFRNLVARALLGLSEEEHEAFFRAMLGDVEEPTAPYGLLQVQSDGSGIREARVEVGAELAQMLRARARALGVSAASLCHLAWAQVLARLSGREDVVFGTVLFGRMHGDEGADRAMGLFINTLPLRVRLGDAAVEECARKTHALLAELLRHEHASLALAQRCSAVAAPTPLFSALLNYRHSGRPAESMADAPSNAWEGIRQIYGEERSNYPLTMAVDDFGDGFSLRCQAVQSVDSARVCLYMQMALQAIAGALAAEPATPMRGLDVLPPSERTQILDEWNATAAPYPDAFLHEQFEAQTARTPHTIAVSDGRVSLDYAELNGRANQIAHHLWALGVRPDDRVAVCTRRSVDMLVSLLAVWKAGGAYVPLDPAYPLERLTFMLDDAAPVALISDGRTIPALDGRLPVIDLGADSGPWTAQPRTNPDPRGRGLEPGHLAYLIYTSGSSGRPKGAGVEHRSLQNLLHWYTAECAMTPADVLLVATSYSFDLTQKNLFGPLLTGGRVVLAPEPFDSRTILPLIAEQRVSMMNLTPSAFHALIDADAGGVLARLRLVVLGGEPIQPARLQRIPAPRCAFMNGYGPTECTAVVAFHHLSPELERYGNGSVPIGRPIPNSRLYILDKQLRPVPIGAIGEILIGGVPVGRGYHGRPELTDKAFLRDPFVADPAARMYGTGDLGRFLDDGSIEFLGRDDGQVKSRGFRIELGEIEAQLAAHPAIREAAVAAIDDDAGGKRLVAYYVLRDDTVAPSEDDLRDSLAARLPEYMVPAGYVCLDALPLTPSAKLDRRALPSLERRSASGRQDEPQSEVEWAVAKIWADLLKVPHVGRHDHFFAMGGHSLMAIQVASRIREVLGVDIELSTLFEAPVLADFAAVLPAAPHAVLPPILPAPEEQRRALSFAQQRLWFLSRFEGVSEAYHMPFGIRLIGQLDGDALRRALDRLVQRHESLRTTFHIDDGEPRQVIASWGDSRFTLIEHDLRGRAESELEDIAASEARAPFDFARGPLIRGRLIRIADDDHTLLITQHHIISDGWSIGILLDELSALYAAFRAGEPDPLPPLTIQYADYAAWQRRWIAGEVLQKQAQYWRETLAGAPALLPLPADRPRPAEQDYAGAAFEFSLDAGLTRGLRALSQRHGTTLFMTMLASWAAVLSRLSGERDVVIGTPVANRGRAEIEHLIGFFVNTLALRFDLSDDPTVAQLLERVKAQTITAQQNQDIPFEQVVELVRPVRSLSHSPVVQVIFNWRSGGGKEFGLAGLTPVPGVGTADVTAKFDLVLSVGELGEDMAGGVEYATALFDRTTIERYLRHWRNLLEAMVADERQPISKLRLMTVEERAGLLRAWTTTCISAPRQELLHECFERQAEARPEAPAIIDGAHVLRYGEVNARANQMAHYLRELGVGAESRVAICLERGADMVVALLAILKAGGAYVPIDPRYPAERIEYMLRDSEPVALITQDSLKEIAGVTGIPMLAMGLTASAWSGHSQANLPPADALTPASLAYIIYTSGSTGRPKGVMVEHANVIRLFTATDAWFGFGPSDVWTLFHSLAFDFSVWEIFGALLFGGRLVIIDQETARSPELFYELLCRERVTVLNQTPSASRQLMNAQAASESGHALRYVIFGGEALETATLGPWFQRNDPEQTRLVNMYGITETTVHVTYRPLALADVKRGGSPIGEPIPDLRLYLLDQHREPVPTGVTGELYVGGAAVARGYLNRPELTEQRFIADPFMRGERLYKTGDLARYLSSGEMEFIGRNDLQVKIRGFRIELGEIESRIAEYPGVREATVIAWDEGGDKRLVAYYVASAAAPFGADELRAHLSDRLPGYMVPAAFVRLEEMPLTRSGKLDRAALPAPQGDAFGNRTYDQPQGTVETTLAEIWAELLGVERVGRHENFFELGGHSLLAVTLMERMRGAGLKTDVRAVFTSPTVAGMAAAAQPGVPNVEVPPNRIPEDCHAITPAMLPLVELTPEEIERVVATVEGGAANVQDIYPLAPLQEGILFHHVAATDGDPYVLSRILRFGERAHLDAFGSALQSVIDRHDILRTGVVWKDLSTPVQVVWRRAQLSFADRGPRGHGRRCRGPALRARQSPPPPPRHQPCTDDASLRGARSGRGRMVVAAASPSPGQRPRHDGSDAGGDRSLPARPQRGVAAAGSVPRFRRPDATRRDEGRA
jgi:amino acid adenylation domain-containing protein